MSDLSSSTYNGLVDLGRRLYDEALVRSDQEDITDPRGQPIGWLLDTRMPMLSGHIMPEVGRVLGERLAARGIHQSVGLGFGSYTLVSSVVASTSNPPFMGGFIRENRKPHGRKRLVEGPVSRDEPVVLLDDILNSGRSALKAVELLRQDGFNVVGLMCLFHFTWSGGRARMESSGLWVDSLLDLNLRDGE
jgi:orotate phosphoribosyltransferase